MDKNQILHKEGGELLIVNSAPHMRTPTTTARMMLDVIIALVPAIIAAVVLFGFRALLLIAVSVVTCVVAEAVTQKLLKKKVRIKDLSAVVTGILLAFNVPVGMPIWMLVFAGIFSIVIVKEFFGGIGANFMNPALAGRALLLAAWPGEMSTFVTPFDAVSTATPLSGGATPGLMDLFLGNVPGVIGEVSKLALLIGAAYLLIRRVIHLRIPVVFIASTALFLFIMGVPAGDLPAQILSGGLILGAFFMATDFVTNPMTRLGQIIFALGAGLITALIRVHGGYPEGVSYGILLMNICTPLIDKLCTRRVFGGGKE